MDVHATANRANESNKYYVQPEAHNRGTVRHKHHRAVHLALQSQLPNLLPECITVSHQLFDGFTVASGWLSKRDSPWRQWHYQPQEHIVVDE